MSPFQRRVYEAVATIPHGKVASYKWVANQIGCGSAQAIGQALAKNPFAPSVPCHRVIPLNGRIGGYCGSLSHQNVQRKIDLLLSEGVKISKDKIVSKTCFV